MRSIYRANLWLLATAAAVVGASVAAATHQAASTPPSTAAVTGQPAAQYVGSASCRRCHTATYERWSKTRMANVVTDPKAHPEVVIPDFSKPDPLLTFRLDEKGTALYAVDYAGKAVTFVIVSEILIAAG